MNCTAAAIPAVSRSWARSARIGLCALLTVFVTGMTAVSGAFAGASPPTIDGNLNDLISYASGTGQGCLDTANLPVESQPVAGDVCKTNALLIPCTAPQVACASGTGKYFLNGYDLTRAVAAYDRSTKTLYLGSRVAGTIGDSDGDGLPNAGAICTPALNPGEQRIQDAPGIGFNESYTWGLDTNCDGKPDIFIGVTSGTGGVANVAVSGASAGATQGAYAGSDLEVKITNIDLPFVYAMTAFAGSTTDGLSEDATPQVKCGPPNVNIELTKIATPPAICAGAKTTFTLTVHNTGQTPLTTTLTDQLPASLTFDDNVAGDFTLLSATPGGLITFNDLVIPAGETRSVSFRVQSAVDCLGVVTNNAHVVGQYSEPCIILSEGQPLRVEKDASATVTCSKTTCSISAPDTHVCPGEKVDICGPDGPYTYAWSTGETTKCISVGAGTYSLVITNTETGCVSDNTCSVTIIEDPKPVCSISAPDTHVCPGEKVTICGPDGPYTYAWSTGETTKCISVGAGTYSLVITNTETGCKSDNTCSVTIIEDPKPVCSISAPDTHVCPGEKVDICGPDGPYTYAWSTGETTKCINVGAGTYSLVITNTETGCVSDNTCSVTIVEDPKPVCSISAPDTHVCPGEKVTICGPDGPFTYAWSTGETTKCISVGAGTYSLVITNTETGCKSDNTCSVTIIEDPKPVCSISAPDTHVCPGEKVDICGPDGPYTYAWSNGQTTKCINVGAGTYSLVITNTETGCVSDNTCSVTIIEDPKPVCSISAPDTHVCPGEKVTICGPDGPYTYAWSTGETTKCISVGAGTYSLVITNTETGCVSDNTCSVTIIEDPKPVCSISAPNTHVCPGGKVDICGPDGPYTYAWSNGQTTKCINVGAGTYSLVITNTETGCKSDNTCSVTIIEDPVPVCSISAPDTHVCPGEKVTICGPDGPFTYSWSTGETTKCITVGAGTYTLTITNSETGCVGENKCSVTIIEDPKPVCSISAPDTHVCPGEKVDICGPDGPYTYAWSNGETTKCINVGAGTYSLVITNTETGCKSDNTCSVTIVQDPKPVCSISAPDTHVCAGEKVDICGPDGPYTYAWSTGETTKCINVGAGTYTLVITNTETGCKSDNTCSVTIIEDKTPVCTISAPDTHVCPGEKVTICGPDGAFTYSWSTGETTKCITVGAGTYTLTITNTQTGCAGEGKCSVTIIEDPKPVCSIDAKDTHVCPGEKVDICGPAGPYTYAWSNGATTKCINVGAGTYSLVITSKDTGCKSDNTCSVTIIEDPRPVCSITGNLEICPAGGTTQLCGPDGPYTYLWSNGQTTKCITVGPGTYSLVITNTETGCVSNNSCSATVDECEAPGLCRLTGGGCLNEDGDNKGHKQSTFGGNSSPAHEGGGPTGNSWEHVYRDGRTILFNWHSWDAHVIACSVVPPGPCSPPAINTRADFVGTGKYSIGAGGRDQDGNMVAYIIDHREGACNKNNRDEYSIIVRTGLVIGEGTIVFQTSGEIDCGNLQIHETPARLFGSGTTLSGEVVPQSESVALLNRAYPNPFSGVTTYNYRVEGPSAAVEVGVYNVAGRLVKTLASGAQSQGMYTVTWNGTDEAGMRMAPGVYFLKARVDAASTVNRIIYISR